MKRKVNSNALRESLALLGDHPATCTVVVILALVYTGMMLSVPIFMGNAIDLALGGIITPDLVESRKFLFFFYVGLMSGFTLLSGVAQYFFEYAANLLAQETVKSLRDSVFEKLSYLPIKAIDSRPHGDMLSLVTVDTENVMTGLTALLKQLIEGVFTLLFTIAFMFYLNWILAAVVLLLTPLSFFVSIAVSKHTGRNFKAQAKTAGALAGLTLERIRNYRAVRSFNLQRASQDRFNEIDQRLYVEGQKAQFMSSWTNPSTRLVNNVVYATIAVTGAILLASGSLLEPYGAVLTIGGLSIFLNYALKFAKPFNEISSVATEIQNAEASMARLSALLAQKDERQLDKDLASMVPANLRTIEFSAVEFGYEPNQKVIKGLDLDVYAGHKMAIVGPTGCGKTTLINLLLRFYDPVNGKILLGGIDSAGLKRGKVRSLFGMVLQDTWIFKGTIRENIAYAKPDATLAEIKRAAEKAQANQFIERLPHKYDEIISADGGLSEGEKQLISIARVILLDPKMIILDEATSSLDAVSEKKITAAIAELSSNRTSIVIAHRLQTIVSADAIAVMENGKVGEIGTHDELMAKKGAYYRMYTSQYN